MNERAGERVALLPVRSSLYCYLRGSYGREPTHKASKRILHRVQGSKALLGIASVTTWYLIRKYRRTGKGWGGGSFLSLGAIFFRTFHSIFLPSLTFFSWYNIKPGIYKWARATPPSAPPHSFHVWLNFRGKVKGQAWVALCACQYNTELQSP